MRSIDADIKNSDMTEAKHNLLRDGLRIACHKERLDVVRHILLVEEGVVLELDICCSCATHERLYSSFRN